MLVIHYRSICLSLFSSPFRLVSLFFFFFCAYLYGCIQLKVFFLRPAATATTILQPINNRQRRSLILARSSFRRLSGTCAREWRKKRLLFCKTRQWWRFLALLTAPFSSSLSLSYSYQCSSVCVSVGGLCTQLSPIYSFLLFLYDRLKHTTKQETNVFLLSSVFCSSTLLFSSSSSFCSICIPYRQK